MSVEQSELEVAIDGLEERNERQPPAQSLGQLLSFRIVLSEVGHNRRVWLATASIGLVIGLAMSFVLHSTASATTTLFLQYDAAVDPSWNMANDVALVQTQGIAQAVVDRLHLHESAQEFLTQYTATSPSTGLPTQVLELNVTAPSGSRAVSEANALSASFLSFRESQIEMEASGAETALTTQLSQITAQINQLSANITSGNNDAATLEAERTQDLGQRAEMQQALETDITGTSSTIAGSGVLDPATVDPPKSRKKTLFKYGATGLLAGLVVGIGAVAAWVVASDRVRRREEASLALDTPIGLSIPKKRSLGRRAALSMRGIKRPRQETVLLARHLRSKLAERRCLAVVSIDSLDAVALAVGRAAVELERSGDQVLVVDLSEGRVLAKLFNLKNGQMKRIEMGNSSDLLWMFAPAAYEAHNEHVPQVGAVLVITNIHPGFDAEALRQWASEALVVVMAGRSSAEKLRYGAELLRAAGIKIDSGALIGADRDDYSSGSFGSDASPLPGNWP